MPDLAPKPPPQLRDTRVQNLGQSRPGGGSSPGAPRRDRQIRPTLRPVPLQPLKKPSLTTKPPEQKKQEPIHQKPIARLSDLPHKGPLTPQEAIRLLQTQPATPPPPTDVPADIEDDEGDKKDGKKRPGPHPRSR